MSVPIRRRGHRADAATSAAEDEAGAVKINAATSAPPSQPRQRPLKVEDALAFLDEVKQRIPAAYNQLLDTMKEFKSGNIDTPDVLERVLHLFHGHR